jgi:hypothetical protein
LTRADVNGDDARAMAGRRMRHQTHRLTVSFSEDAMAWIRREAASRAVSYAELLKRLVDENRGSAVIRRDPQDAAGGGMPAISYAKLGGTR